MNRRNSGLLKLLFEAFARAGAFFAPDQALFRHIAETDVGSPRPFVLWRHDHYDFISGQRMNFKFHRIRRFGGDDSNVCLALNDLLFHVELLPTARLTATPG